MPAEEKNDEDPGGIWYKIPMAEKPLVKAKTQDEVGLSWPDPYDNYIGSLSFQRLL